MLRNILFLTALLIILLALGSLGFVWLEGWSFFDALYMTVTTLTTLGGYYLLIQMFFNIYLIRRISV